MQAGFQPIVDAFNRFLVNMQPLIHLVFGQIQWSAPDWLKKIFHGLGWVGDKSLALHAVGNANPKQAQKIGITVALLVAGISGGVWWYEHLPKPVPPHQVTFNYTHPSLSNFANNSIQTAPLMVYFSESAAPLDKAAKAISTGISIEPKLDGAWRWSNDQILIFEPKEDWAVGAEYKVTLDKKTFVQKNVLLNTYDFKFHTAPFEMKISQSEFYVDPTDVTQKKVVATFNFSHPVDPKEFEKRLMLQLQGQKSGVLGIGTETTKFTVTYDKHKLNAYVHSVPLPVPDKDTNLKITLDKGLRALRGGDGTTDKLEHLVAVPGVGSLRVTKAEIALVNNERFEPEQVLVLDISASVNEKDLQPLISAVLLPKHPPKATEEERKQPYIWSGTADVDDAVIKASAKLKIDPIAGEREVVSLHSFKMQAEPGRQIYVKVNKGLTAAGGYKLVDDHTFVLKVPPFPKEIRIMADGSLLALKGEKKISVYGRSIPAMRFDVARVLPSQIQHWVTQAGENFGKPEFNNSGFDITNLSEHFTEVRELPKAASGKAQYQGFDLAKYLDANENKFGLFLVKAEAYDPVKKSPLGQSDQRFILVTDLGVLVKKAADGSQEIFVQSVETGDPVSGANVDILGRNGVSLLSKTTDAEGHVSFPDIKNFKREQQPVVYTIRKGADMSFLPINRRDRQVDISRFDIGGMASAPQADKLSAYLFSDRGIYRPGDSVNLGMIIKAADWKQKLGDLPLEVVINDARGLTVKRERIKTSAQGFEEFRYTSLDTSTTGTYTATLFIVKDGKADAQIGGTTFKVQEFLPDRMKMMATLSAEVKEGWVSPENLKAKINLMNLFGTPAANRRVTANVTLTPSYPSFPSYKDFVFYDPQRAVKSVTDTLTEETTDDSGEVTIDLSLQRYATRASYFLNFVAQGFEAEGGRSVAAEAGTMVSSMPYLVGYKTNGDVMYLKKDTERKIDWIAIDAKAKKIALDKLTLTQIERKYVSVLVKQENGTYKYQSVRKDVTVAEKNMAISASGLSWPLPTTKPGDFTLILKDAQGLELSHIDYNVAAEGNLTRNLEKNAELQITLNKADFAAEEEVEMQIRAPYVGSGLITIEREKVHSHRWFKTTTTNSIQKIKLPAGLEGNGYVTVTFVRDLNSEEIFASPMSHGVAPFTVSIDKRKEKVVLTASDLAKPGEPFKMKIKTDQPSRAIVFAVDEGILQVAGYKGADPLSYFFQKRALEVRTSQILDLILPEFKRIMAAAPGGDAAGAIGKHLNPFKRKRDKPVAYWSGIINTGPEEKELVYDVPDYFNGTLRLMVVSVNDDTLGTLQQKTQIRGDFVINPNPPTTVAPGDEFDVSVAVSNNVVGSGKNAVVALTLATSNHFAIVGKPNTELKIAELREGVATYRLRAKDMLGSGSLNFTTALNGKTGKIATDISIRPVQPFNTSFELNTVRNGKLSSAILRDLYPDYRKVEAGMSVLPLAMAQGLKSYLDKFPHGCTEQLTSQGFPAVVLSNRPEFGFAPAHATESIQSIFSQLRTRQNSEGGFGLWPGYGSSHDYASVYATHFLMEARDRGFAVPPDMLKNTQNYLQTVANTDVNSLYQARLSAYAIYLLTRQGIVTTNYAAALQKRLEQSYAKEWRGDLSAVYLAAAYQLMKQERLANATLDGFKLGQNPDRRFEYYYDSLVSDAMYIYIVAKHFPQRAQKLPPDTMNNLVKPIQRGSYNTLSSAYTILAVEAYAQTASTSANAKFVLRELDKAGAPKELTLPAGLFPKSDISPDAAKVEFESANDFTAYTMLAQSGFERGLPKQEVSVGLEVLREYTNLAGSPISKVKIGEEIEVHIKMRSLSSDYINNIAIIDLLPGGFEIVAESRVKTETAPSQAGSRHKPKPAVKNETTEEDAEDERRHRPRPSQNDMEGEGDGNREGNEGEAEGEVSEGAQESQQWEPPIGRVVSNFSLEYADVREDRIIIYGTANRGVGEFVYRIKATNAGTFNVPPTYGESMYDRSVQAKSMGGKLTVEK
jgi:alpha-2-macroglobulin